MMKVIHTLIALLCFASMATRAQEPGVPMALQAIAGGGSAWPSSDSLPVLQVNTGFYQTLPLAWMDAAGLGSRQGNSKNLYRTAFFISVNRSLGRHFSAGFCLPWYRTSVEYSGDAHAPGLYEVEKISEIRLYLDYQYPLGPFVLMAEAGTNIPVGNGLPSALHPAFPPGENGYWSVWVKTGMRMKARANLDLYSLISFDYNAPRSGALAEGSDALLFTSGAVSSLQATVDPGDRAGFTAGAVVTMRRVELSVGYGFLYKYQTKAHNILPVIDQLSGVDALMLMPRSVLHTVHSGCFRSWHAWRFGVMVQAGVGGFNTWSEVLMSGLIRYNFQ